MAASPFSAPAVVDLGTAEREPASCSNCGAEGSFEVATQVIGDREVPIRWDSDSCLVECVECPAILLLIRRY